MITGHVTDEDDMLTTVYDEDWNRRGGRQDQA